MTIYLIDYENTKSLTGIASLTNEDMVVVFYTKNSNTLTFDTHKEIIDTQATIRYMNVGNGTKNALDFQLASYLGYLIKEKEQNNVEYYIVSKDKGFLVLQSFWKEKYIDINVIEDFSGKELKDDNGQPACEETKKTKTKAQKTTAKNNRTLTTDIGKVLSESELNLPNNDIVFVEQTVHKYKTKQAINNELMKHFKDSEKVGDITKTIKPFLKEKK